MIEVGEPRPLAGDEVLVEVRAAGVANWDEFVRTGGWDVGGRPPMALGVEAAGTVLAAGPAAGGWAPGDAVMTHPVPLRDQGTWAPRLIAAAGLLARKPPNASWEATAAFPVPGSPPGRFSATHSPSAPVSRSWSTGPAASPAACWSPSPCCAARRSSRRQARQARSGWPRWGQVTSSTTKTQIGPNRPARSPGAAW